LKSPFRPLPWSSSLALLTFCVLSGCGGGAAPATSSPNRTIAPPTTTLRIVVPSATTASARERTPAFVSAGALSMAVSIYTVATNGTIATVPLSTTNVDLVPSANCSGTPLTCAIALNAPLGLLTFGVSLYSQLGEGGSVLATFVPSVQHEFTIVQNTNNVIGISLDGVPASMVITTLPTTLTAGTASNALVSIVARDASGNVIVGTDPYAAPIALVDNDTTGSTSLSVANITSPTTTTTLTYGGGPLTGSLFTLVAQFPATPSPLTASVQVGVLNTNGVTAVPSVVSFLSTAQAPQDVTYGEAAYVGTFTVADPGCASVATVLDLGGSLHITPLGVGSCSVTITDNAAHTASVTIGVTQTQVVGQ
jgi:hypothetical protein